MPRIMNISKGLARLRTFMPFNPAKMSARLAIEFMNYAFSNTSHLLAGIQFGRNRQIIRKLGSLCELRGLAGFAVTAKLVDIGQHLRHGVIKLMRNLITQFGMVVKGACKRRSFQQRHLMLLADFTNFEGEKMCAFCNDAYLSATE